MLVLIFSISTALSQSYKLEVINSNTGSYFRAASVVDDRVAWVSGSKGVVGRSRDGGRSWKFIQVPGYEKLEFRSLYAFDSLHALIANAGSPAYIMKTIDGGRNWKTVYQNSDPEAFVDGMDFWDNSHGVVYGDAIKGAMLLVMTMDGGSTWTEVPPAGRPQLKEGEGSFAASGTNIRCLGKSTLLIATGGKVSRLFVSHDKGVTWKIEEPPIIQGSVMTGIFSLAFANDNDGIVVGGNYEIDSLKKDHVLLTRDGGKTWSAPQRPTGGIREGVEYVGDRTLVAAGYPGVDISLDGGKNWSVLSAEKQFAVVRKARKGSLVMLAGGAGKIGFLKK